MKPHAIFLEEGFKWKDKQQNQDNESTAHEIYPSNKAGLDFMKIMSNQ